MSKDKRYTEFTANEALEQRARDTADWQKLVSRGIKRKTVEKRASRMAKLVKFLTGKGN